ncbi:MAG: M1 family aminopeptidase [Litorimonas sp.]
MLRSLLAFELKLHTRTVGFWLALIVMIAFGVLFSSTEALSAGGARVKTNGAIPIASIISSFSLLSIFFAAVFVVTGVMRDDTHKSLEIIHSTPVTTPDMILSRMLGVWFATILALSGLVLGTMAGPFMPWADQATFQPFNFIHYLQPFFLFIVVNALIVSSIYTVIAVTSRNRTLVYVSAVGLLVLYLIGGAVAGQNPPEWFGAMSSPFGDNALFFETQYWSAAEQNEQMAPVMGWVGLNRLIYGLIGLALFGLSFVLSARGIQTRRSKRRVDDTPPTVANRVAPITPSLDSRFTLSAFWTRLKFEYITTVRSTPFLILMGIAISLFGFILLVTLMMGVTTTLPTSSFMTQVALGSLLLPMLIIMVFFGSDIMWRDRTANMHGIMDATPVRNVSLLFAKWGAMAGILLTIILGLLVAGMIAQAIVGFDKTPVVPMTFLAVGIVNFFVRFFLLAMLVMFIQNFMPGRIVGMLVAGGVLVGLIFFLGQLPFYHPMMSFGSIGAGAYSEMAGFSSPQSFWWRFAYWMGLILVLGALSVWLWRRGLQIGLGDRLTSMRKRLTVPSLATAALGVALFAGFGYAGLSDYRAQEYMNQNEAQAQAAEFERVVGDLWTLPDPRIVDVKVNAQFYPSERTAVFNGTYVIDNPYDAPIVRTTVVAGQGLDNLLKLDIEGARRVTGETVADRLADEFERQVIEFDPPLQPGERRTVTFETRFDAPTLTSGSAIRVNGTFVNNASALLTFGNLEQAFLQSNDTRRQNDLEERMRWPDREDEAARRYHLITSFSGYADYVDFEAEVCTDQSQIPVAPGKFRGETVEDGRRCRSYKSINPILNFFSFLTAEYDVRRDVWENPNGDDVDLEIYFHPEHDFNIDLMIDAMKTSLDTYTEVFSPYQYAQLRIMQFPYGGFAQAFAGTVPFSEGIGFVQDPGAAEDPEQVDFATYITMHEIGHQWFAHQVIGAFAKGANLLSEGLTENATMLAYERHYDFAKTLRMHVERTTQQYLLSRTMESNDEPVLAKAEGQSYLNYQKTSWVFWGMRRIIGNEPVQRAVRRFLLEHHASNGAPYPTTLELLDILKEEIDPQYHALIDDYWNRITFWELRLQDDREVTVTPSGDRFTVSVPLSLDKNYASEEDGKETSVSELEGETLDEWVQIGFYTEDPEDDLGASPFALETVRVSEAESVLTFTLDQRPTYVVLDPHRALIERNVNDNSVRVEDAVDS